MEKPGRYPFLQMIQVTGRAEAVVTLLGHAEDVESFL